MTELKFPTNTVEKENRRRWLFGGDPSAIEDQEERGQKEFCACSCLPTRILDGVRNYLQKDGVQFGEFSADQLFQKVILPDGWRIEPTEHSMWSVLLDANNYIRAEMFYKAAFYDRSAHMFVTDEPVPIDVWEETHQPIKCSR